MQFLIFNMDSQYKPNYYQLKSTYLLIAILNKFKAGKKTCPPSPGENGKKNKGEMKY